METQRYKSPIHQEAVKDPGAESSKQAQKYWLLWNTKRQKISIITTTGCHGPDTLS